MAGLDYLRLSKTLSHFLRPPQPDGLKVDDEGWVSFVDLSQFAARAIRRPVLPEDIALAVSRHGGGRYDLDADRIRVREGPVRPDPRGGGPDLLFHALPNERVSEVVRDGRLTATSGSRVFLSRTEPHAWRVAHRAWTDPMVIFVDAARARRDGVVFDRNKAGLYTTEGVPLRHLLNLRDGFAEQASAGGFLVDWTSGVARVALIKVARRHGATWEVAKGKIEPGEAPANAAVREVKEEMGIDVPVVTRRTLGTVRYGFYTREGAPRLKTIYLFLVEATEMVGTFTPAGSEGIEAVRWFEVAELVQALAHPSLRASLGRLLEALDERAKELGLDGLDPWLFERARQAG